MLCVRNTACRLYLALLHHPSALQRLFWFLLMLPTWEMAALGLDFGLVPLRKRICKNRGEGAKKHTKKPTNKQKPTKLLVLHCCLYRSFISFQDCFSFLAVWQHLKIFINVTSNNYLYSKTQKCYAYAVLGQRLFYPFFYPYGLQNLVSVLLKCPKKVHLYQHWNTQQLPCLLQKWTPICSIYHIQDLQRKS